MKNIIRVFSVLLISLFSTMNLQAAEKWDMPMAYSATNFHSQNGVMFADAVRIATGGEIDITVHPGGSLFKGGEIKKAIQTGQVPIGERLLSGHQNESLIFGTDSIPFLATSPRLWPGSFRGIRGASSRTSGSSAALLFQIFPPGCSRS